MWFLIFWLGKEQGWLHFNHCTFGQLYMGLIEFLGSLRNIVAACSSTKAEEHRSCTTSTLDQFSVVLQVHTSNLSIIYYMLLIPPRQYNFKAHCSWCSTIYFMAMAVISSTRLHHWSTCRSPPLKALSRNNKTLFFSPKLVLS